MSQSVTTQPTYEVKNEIKDIPKQKEEFKCCPISNVIYTECCISMDTGKPAIYSDQHAHDSCCTECQCLVCFIPAVLFDITITPFRYIHYKCT